MASSPSPLNAYVGRGKAYFSRFLPDGTFTGVWRELGSCRQIRTTPEITKIQLSNTRTKASSTYAEAITDQKANVAIELDEYDAQNVALALMGDVASFVQTGASITAEQLADATHAAKDRTYFTAQRDISAVAVKQGATTLVLNTDYQILDAAAGAIHILDSSPAFVSGTALTVDYTSGAITAKSLVQMASQGNIKGALRVITDPVVGPKMDARWWNVSFTPDGDVPFITDEFGSLSLAGTALDDTTGLYGGSASAPFGTILYL